METTTETQTVTETTTTSTPPPKGSPKAKVKRAKAKVRKVRARKGSKGAKKVARKHKPTTGQSGPSIEDLGYEDLNAKEVKLIQALGDHVKQPMTIVELGAVCFTGRSKFQQNSWTRNSLRRLICGGLVDKLSRGVYKLSTSGLKKLHRAQA